MALCKLTDEFGAPVYVNPKLVLFVRKDPDNAGTIIIMAAGMSDQLARVYVSEDIGAVVKRVDASS